MLQGNARRSQNAATKVVVPAHPLWCAVSAVCSRVKLYPNRLLYALGLCQTLDDVEVIPSTEPKAVLEHRAPKTSPPILHTGGVESKVGRAVHCAPHLNLDLHSAHGGTNEKSASIAKSGYERTMEGWLIFQAKYEKRPLTTFAAANNSKLLYRSATRRRH